MAKPLNICYLSVADSVAPAKVGDNTWDLDFLLEIVMLPLVHLAVFKDASQLLGLSLFVFSDGVGASRVRAILLISLPADNTSRTGDAFSAPCALLFATSLSDLRVDSVVEVYCETALYKSY